MRAVIFHLMSGEQDCPLTELAGYFFFADFFATFFFADAFFLAGDFFFLATFFFAWRRRGSNCFSVLPSPPMASLISVWRTFLCSGDVSCACSSSHLIRILSLKLARSCPIDCLSSVATMFSLTSYRKGTIMKEAEISRCEFSTERHS